VQPGDTTNRRRVLAVSDNSGSEPYRDMHDAAQTKWAGGRHTAEARQRRGGLYFSQQRSRLELAGMIREGPAGIVVTPAGRSLARHDPGQAAAGRYQVMA